MVSTPCLLDFFLCCNFCIYLHSPVSECPLLAWFLSVLTCISICTLQLVSAPCLPSFFLSWLANLSVLSRKWVPFAHLVSFHVLTCPSICPLQLVSSPCLLGFLLFSDLSIYLYYLGSKWTLLAWFLSIFWLVYISAISRMWVSLAHIAFFHILTYLPICIL